MSQLFPEIAGLTWPQFVAISRLVKTRCGINLHAGKIPLIEARLQKRLKQLGLADFSKYVDLICSDADGKETTAMIDALSTNVTHFFRESHHFNYFVKIAIPWFMHRHAEDRCLRIWSAGCSSGEEPYSIAILLRNKIINLEDWDVRILATDLSHKILQLARRGEYESRQLRHTPQQLIRQNFRHHRMDSQDYYQIKEPIKRMVDFAHLNLMDKWPMKGPFDAIFFRNVMIYFDKPTQQFLLKRLWEILGPGGLLFIGHSESLSGIANLFNYLQPAIYQKCLTSEDDSQP